MLLTKRGVLNGTTFVDSITGESMEVIRIKNKIYSYGDVYILLDYYDSETMFLLQTIPASL